MTAPEWVIVGRVRKVHGLQGELVVEPITDRPDAVFASGRRVFAGTPGGTIARDRRDAVSLVSAGRVDATTVSEHGCVNE